LKKICSIRKGKEGKEKNLLKAVKKGLFLCTTTALVWDQWASFAAQAQGQAGGSVWITTTHPSVFILHSYSF